MRTVRRRLWGKRATHWVRNATAPVAELVSPGRSWLWTMSPLFRSRQSKGWDEVRPRLCGLGPRRAPSWSPYTVSMVESQSSVYQAWSASACRSRPSLTVRRRLNIPGASKRASSR